MDIILGIIVVLLIGVVIYLVLNGNKKEDGDSMRLLQEQVLNLNRTLDQKLTENTKTLEDKLSNTNKTLDTKLNDANKLITDNMQKTFATSTKINEEANKRIEDITKKLTQLEETNKQIKDIGGQLRGLENILKNPKQRGNLGEYFLLELLENVFNPDQYKIQYTIEGVGIVDAALFIGGKIIPIDSKFPQENYERLIDAEDDEIKIKKYSTELKKDLKNRIDETSKYIMPERDTTDFAFMLIPAEGMYYDIFINKVGDIEAKKLIEYAFSKKVIICSPSSFYAYLQTVIQGMKALQIEEQAKEIQKYVIKLQKDLANYEELFQKVGRNLGTTVNSYNDAYKRFNIVDKDIIKITGGESSADPLALSKPEIDL
ncbi:MAG: DNA recombination protein RmuC [Candidatus Gracilibacteria bacterium]|nr:DNA recombination protein RmuC [Candidatus Gracilibacteria bacterium]